MNSSVSARSDNSLGDLAHPDEPQTRKDGAVTTYRGPDLAPWQLEAIDAWQAGDSRGPRRGTLEVFTGGGKTLLAIYAYCLTQAERLAVVVPTQALQDQWVEELLARTDLQRHEIGRLGGGHDDTFRTRRVLVAVLNSAATKLPALSTGLAQDLMLVVDECHRAGAPRWSKVLQTQAKARLGLSATPDREELDDAGEPIDYDQQVLGRELGEVVFSFDLRRARAEGWLPDYTIHHHGVELTTRERRDYDQVTRLVDDLADQLRSTGHEPGRARMLMGRSDATGKAAAGYVGATAKRKDLLYRATERQRVATTVITDLYATRSDRRVLVFHERVTQATELHDLLAAALPVPTALENSTLTKADRQVALHRFASGAAPVLVSVKSLVEGINVPAADVGISVASSSSVRQRIQSLGRVLRRTFDGAAKAAEMHVVYVADTVDELIYAKEDWSDLTGEAANRYHRWPLGSVSPTEVPDPPRTPKASEYHEWSRLAGQPLPQPWQGVVPQTDYSVNTRGTVTLPDGRAAVDAQDVAAMVAAIRGTPGGRFKLTPNHRLVLVFRDSQPWLVGQLPAPFAPVEAATSVDETTLVPGCLHEGPTDKAGGTYRLRQRAGGLLESSSGDTRGRSALTTGTDPRAANAAAVLSAWKATGLQGGKLHVNSLSHAYLPDGPTYLANVPGGFTWLE